jgi:hypothetical protein
MTDIGDHDELLVSYPAIFICLGPLTDAGAADGDFQPAAVEQVQQMCTSVLHQFHADRGLPLQKTAQMIVQERHGAHDGADGQAPTMSVQSPAISSRKWVRS